MGNSNKISITVEEEVDENRLILRNIILESLVNPCVEQGMSTEDIAAELMVVAAMITNNDSLEFMSLFSRFNVSEPDSSEYVDEGMPDDTNYDFDEYIDRTSIFYDSELIKEIRKLEENADRLHSLGRHEEALNIYEKAALKYPDFAKKWIEIIGESNQEDEIEYPSLTHRLSYLMRAYAILLDKNKILVVMDIARRINKITNSIIDLEILSADYIRFSSDISNAKKIYDFLKTNHGFPQNKIYAELSLDGRKSSYILEWAEKFNKITRVRYKDTWLLTVI